MAVSLEVRAPLLDHRVVELALGLPASLEAAAWFDEMDSAPGCCTSACRGELIDRPKMGFGVPLDGLVSRTASRADGCPIAPAPTSKISGSIRVPVRRMWTDFKTGQSHRSRSALADVSARSHGRGDSEQLRLPTLAPTSIA